MPASASLIPELDQVIRYGSPQRRAETLERITVLFLDGASRFNEDHVGLFDRVLGRLIDAIETESRRELSHRLAPIGNAPAEVMRRLARDDDIEIARPVLEQSLRIAEIDLLHIARTKSQAHLLAISGRADLAESVTDVLVQRGDHEVAHKVAENRDAQLSDRGLSKLVGRAEGDGMLAGKVLVRPDIPPRLCRDLLLKATGGTEQRSFASDKLETQAEVRRVGARVSNGIGASASSRIYSLVQQAIAMLCREGKLDELKLVEFARKGQYEETVAALACLCGVPIEVVERLMGGDRADPVLVLCKSAGWGWPTAKAIIMVGPGAHRWSSRGLDAAHVNFDCLSSTTAQRVMRFWQVRTI